MPSSPVWHILIFSKLRPPVTWFHQQLLLVSLLSVKFTEDYVPGGFLSKPITVEGVGEGRGAHGGWPVGWVLDPLEKQSVEHLNKVLRTLTSLAATKTNRTIAERWEEKCSCLLSGILTHKRYLFVCLFIYFFQFICHFSSHSPGWLIPSFCLLPSSSYPKASDPTPRGSCMGTWPSSSPSDMQTQIWALQLR